MWEEVWGYMMHCCCAWEGQVDSICRWEGAAVLGGVGAYFLMCQALNVSSGLIGIVVHTLIPASLPHRPNACIRHSPLQVLFAHLRFG